MGPGLRPSPVHTPTKRIRMKNPVGCTHSPLIVVGGGPLGERGRARRAFPPPPTMERRVQPVGDSEWTEEG